jgi:enamine deaminase RidA (YjgF/YER057c/UK114 family)
MTDSLEIDTQRRALRSRRSPWVPQRAAFARRGPDCLGGLLYGAEPGEQQAAVIGGVPTPLLGSKLPVLDAWLGQGAVRHGASRHGARWQHDDDWLFGVVDVDDDAGIDVAAGQAYEGVFDVLHSTGFKHLLRVWNYLPRINEEGTAMERYKLFNAGRQQAFIDARERAFEGSPAACAIGTANGPLRVRFLAGRHSVHHVENPRQVSAYHYPQRYGPRSPTFSRAALAQAGRDHIALFVSGTASIVGHESVHPGDVRAQVRETVANLRAVLDKASTKSTASWSLRDLQGVVYVRHARHHEAVVDELARVAPELGGAADRLVYLHADICRRELDVEIEGHAIAEGRLL